MKTISSLVRGAALSLLIVSTASASDPKPTLKLAAEGFVEPTVLAPIDHGRLLIADQVGTVHLLSKDGKLSDKLVLDLRGKLAKLNDGAFDERGLVGMAVHPKFVQNRKFYAYYSAPLRASAPTNFDHTTHVSEFTLAADGTAGEERLLLAFDLPWFNHHSGRMAFGPDGFLYIAVGDGGNRDDTGKGHSEQGNGQDTSTLLGKVLRIDVDHKDGGKEYAVPRDNPFASNGKGAPEIFAYGLRNPWGLSFDRAGKHELFLADVGQESWEEIDIVVKGGNYGWRLREGFVCFDPKKPKSPPDDCPKVGANGEPLIDPIVAYKNFGKFTRDPEARGVSVTGGYVYRGKALPQLVGKYVFADWSRSWAKPDGVIYVASKSGDKWTMDTLDLASHANGGVGNYVVAMGEDADGELYVLTNTSNLLKGKNGKVWKLTAE